MGVIGTPIDVKVTTITGKIDPKADLSLKRVANIYSAKEKKVTDVNSLQIHAKEKKGGWVLVHDGSVVKTKGYIEKGTVFDINIIEFHPTEEVMNNRIKELRLKELPTEEATGEI